MFLKAAGAATLTPGLIPRAAAGVASFEPPIGVCTSVGNAGMLRSAGADYIEEGVRRLLIPGKPDGEFAEKRSAAGACGLPVLAANGFLPGSLKCTGPDANHEGVLKFAETAFIRARAIGIGTIVFGSSGARSIPDGFDRRQAELQFVALLGKMAMLAEPHGVVVAVEPLNRGETNFIHTVAEAIDLVRAVQHPNVAIIADIFHMLREDEPPRSIREAGELIRHVHIAEKAKRTPPGVAGDDFTPYLQALKDMGYVGGISIECRWSNMEQELPVAVQTLRAQMAKVK
jgi:sugar phosphate isomerase/epimerase